MRHSKNVSRLSLVVAVLAMGVTLILAPTPAQAQGDPVEFGAGQLPYIMILMDTSASMEWTSEGDERYPIWEGSGSPGAQWMETWETGNRLNLPGSAGYDSGSPSIAGVGPCQVWAPRCNEYERPAWCAGSDCPWLETKGYTDSNGSVGKMEDRLQTMRAGGPDMRLSSANSPRHVQVKEILAGDMILLDFPGQQNYTRQTHGPGCWFVHRARYGSSGNPEQICDGQDKFDRLVDADDPRPHIQEVFDFRENTGLLSTMQGAAIFGLAMFDGYRDDGTGFRDPDKGWGTTDIIAGESPLGSANWDPASGQVADGEKNNNYNMGIYRVVGPSKLDIPSSYMPALSAFVQLAVVDAGYIHTGRDGGAQRRTYHVRNKPRKKKNKPRDDWPWLNIPDDSFANYMEPYTLGKQPVARATPLAAAFHDVHQYFMNGQLQEEKHDDWKIGELNLTGATVNPFNTVNDPFRKCRAKHVVLLTDGYPEPEAPGGAGNNLGADQLNMAFGYDPARYRYPITEDAITGLVTAELGMDRIKYPRTTPRVHILGINVDDANAARQSDVIHKLAVMAEHGGTCAQYYLDKEMLPPGSFNRNGEAGECVVSDPDSVCLVPQNVGGYPGYDYSPPDVEDGSTVFCQHPALIFTKNDKAVLRDAFSRVFNEIIGSSGVAARTRPSMTSYLDDGQRRGQYRIFSGVRMDGSSVYWKGLLNRQILECETNAGALQNDDGNEAWDELVRMHDEINILRGSRSIREPGPVDEDSRRVFTMVPNNSVYDYEDNISIAADGPFFSRLSMGYFGTKDEFGGTSLTGSSGPWPGYSTTNVVGTRVPFEYEVLKTVYNGGAPGLGWNDEERFYTYFNTLGSDAGESADNFRDLVDEVRGRIGAKSDRVLGGIFNSNPVTVGPPDLDLPVESYRAFRAFYAERPTVLYVSTLDGQLHAIYTGRPNVMQREPTSAGDAGGSSNDISMSNVNAAEYPQREAWAYIPHMLHRRIGLYKDTQPRLMDGSPVVKDVRLCHPSDQHNYNRAACGPDSATPPGVAQWRTVLVQGLGEAGRGYFALDVTRTGSPTQTPDPIPLWEFDHTWEQGQLLAIKEDSSRQQLVRPQDGSDYSVPSDCDLGLIGGLLGGPSVDMWDLPFLGRSIAEPAIGTVVMRLGSSLNDPTIQRPIAMLSAGSSAEVTDGNCGSDLRIGQAIYVNDLQTGSIIRRFVDYEDANDGMKKFDADIVGTPVLFDDFPGSVATRGFVGDSRGRLFRIDFSNPDPREWRASLFFDPNDSQHNMISLHPGDNQFGAASYQPAVAMGPERNLIVVYGLGERGDTSSADQTQLMVAVKEEFDENGNVLLNPSPLWRHRFQKGEKLTGEPVVFNNGVYFTSYYVTDLEDACEAGLARIYGVSFLGNEDDPNDFDAVGIWTPAVGGDGVLVDPEFRWFGPEAPTLIRGVAITMGPACSVNIDDDVNQFFEQDQRQPQLVAQSGGADPGDASDSRANQAAGGDNIGRIAVDLATPTSQTIPLSWTVISN